MRSVVFGLIGAAAVARESVSFDFGWTHRTGLTAAAGPTDRPPENPDPGPDPPEARVAFDDSNWTSVSLPFDALIATAPSDEACPDGCSGNSYIPRHVLWFRKVFTIPAEWEGEVVWLDFEGSFRLTTVWLNGVRAAHHDCGYTPFRVRLDNHTAVRFGAKNLISVFVDPDNGDEGGRDHGSGWWYEGGGLYRHVHLVHASPIHIAQDGLFAYSNLTWTGAAATSAVVHASATLSFESTSNTATAVSAASPMALPMASPACVAFSLLDQNGTRLEYADTKVDVPAGGLAVAKVSLTLSSPRWTLCTVLKCPCWAGCTHDDDDDVPSWRSGLRRRDRRRASHSRLHAYGPPRARRSTACAPKSFPARAHHRPGAALRRAMRLRTVHRATSSR